MLKPLEEGRFEGTYDANGNVLISDMALCDNLPFNLRPIAKYHKQVCGCELCTIITKYHQTLKAFWYEKLK